MSRITVRQTTDHYVENIQYIAWHEVPLEPNGGQVVNGAVSSTLTTTSQNVCASTLVETSITQNGLTLSHEDFRSTHRVSPLFSESGLRGEVVAARAF